MEFRAITLQLDDINEVARLARLAEDAGFSLAWGIDTPRSNAFVHLAAMAANTKTIQIGSGIARAFVRGPLQTAAAAADLDRLSHGRMVLGLGSGTRKQNLYETGTSFDHPASQIKELIRAIRQVWALNGEQDLDFQGKFYRLNCRGFTLTKPIRQDMPIYMAAVNPLMLRVAGEVADGLAGHPCYSARYMKEVGIPEMTVGWQRAGKSRADFKITSWLITNIATDRKQARREAAYQIGFYMSTRSYGGIMDFHGWQKEKEAIRVAFFEKRDMEAVADAVSDDMIDHLALAGTPDDCRQQLERYREVLDFPTLYTAGVGPARTVPQERVRENLQTIIETFAQ
ncbi:MAG: LLM class flavin-dependent oxidoreductase [Deltaproteobacteria bacterium]|nr:LLM class flavin-dependent oxidoreductase [Deltaproteobacteria bacterium]